MRLSVVIPCLDEARTIADVVREALAGLAACGPAVEWSEVVVADNGSTDGSRDLARAAGARVVEAPVRGYGAALHWGIVHARGDHVLLMDADKSHDGMLAPRFVEAARAVPRDVLLGSRLAGEVRPGAMRALNRYVGTPALGAAIRVCFGLRTTDCNSGMRLVSRAFYRRINMRSSGMEWSSELLIKTAIFGGSYGEIPIHVRPDERGRPPHLRRWRDGWRHLKCIVMLAPNAVILAPAAALAAGGAAAAALGEPLLGAGCGWLAFCGFVVGILIKLILHVDGVRPSRLVASMLRGRTADLGVAAAAAAIAAGVSILAVASTRASLASGVLLLATGPLLLLASFQWETVRTVLVSHMDHAWDDAVD